MKLMTLNEWADNIFTPESKPHLNTLHKLAIRGEIPARKLGNKWYVEVDGGRQAQNSTVEKARAKLIQER